AGKSGGDRGKDVGIALGDLWGCPDGIGTTAPATVGEGPGEVSRGPFGRLRRAIVVPAGRDEGPNPLLQGASREDSMGIERRQGTVYQLSL
ncbi:MAG: hypothetical protein IH870_10675, partial [Chloroflexi bacterium]|nr:hypothetical protein [Chloroflexota bacterium]